MKKSYLFYQEELKKLWRKRNNNFRRPRQKGDHSESTSRNRPSKKVTCYECKELGHYINECPKLKKDSYRKEGFKKNSFKTKKGLTATWDDSESDASKSDSKLEQENVAFMATTSGSTSEIESDSEEVFSVLSRSDLEACLSKSLSSYQKLR